MNKEELISYFKNLSLLITSFILIIFPIFFLTSITDPYVISKEILAIIATIILLILFALRMIFEGRITFKATPFNLPIFMFCIVVLLSSLLSKSSYESLIQSVPLLMLIPLFFIIVNSIEDRLTLRVFTLSLITGGAISCILTVLQILKIYILPFQVAQSQYFNTFGSNIQQLLYIAPLLALSIYYFSKEAKEKKISNNTYIYIILSSLLAIGAGFLIYQIFSAPAKPLILPFAYGVQIALNSISQDVKNFFVSFLFGSGYGTFASDFTRFHLASFNQENDIWNIVFSRSSSFFLELVSTTGVLGAISFLFLFVRIIKSKIKKVADLYLPLIILFLLSFILPFSFPVVFLLFILLSLYASQLYIEKTGKVYNITLSFVALKQGLLNFGNFENVSRKEDSVILPYIFLGLSLVVALFVGFFTLRFTISDLKFAESMSSVNLNNGEKIYSLQRDAINTFPYRSDYYQIFSQVNIALANSLANSMPKNSSPSAQTQQTVIALLQQSINSGRTATTLSPLNYANWENLSQIYRNLINVGQNADQFSIASIQQAIALNPYSPILYVELGGIYLQLGQYDLAVNQYQVAANLKPDYANAYYNLGHALEAKGDLKGALAQYQIVKELVKYNKENTDKISVEIDGIKAKIGEQEAGQAQVPASDSKQTPLEISTPSANLPPQKPPVKIPGPETSPAPKATVTPTVTPIP